MCDARTHPIRASQLNKGVCRKLALSARHVRSSTELHRREVGGPRRPCGFPSPGRQTREQVALLVKMLCPTARGSTRDAGESTPPSARTPQSLYDSPNADLDAGATRRRRPRSALSKKTTEGPLQSETDQQQKPRQSKYEA